MTRRAFIILLALAVTPVIASAQPRADEKKPAPTIPADGTEILQYLLDRAKIQPVKQSELRNLGRYDNVIVIVLGDPNRWFGGQAPLQLASTVVRNGGAALIASDSQVMFANNGFPNAADLMNGDVRIPNGTVYGGNQTNLDSLFTGRPAMPFVVPLKPPANPAGPEWQLFEGLSRIATNKPSFILAPNPRGEFASRLATYPDDCLAFNADEQIVRKVDPDTHFFAVGGSGWHPNTGLRYRFLTLADPSVFINQMMLANDPEKGAADNLEFAARVVGYLSEEEGRVHRTRCVFYQNGEVVERFDALRSMMQPPLPLPNIMAMQEKLTDFANKVIDHFETNDTANKAVVGSGETERNRRFKFIMEFILAMLTIRAAWYLLKRLWIAKRPPEAPSAVPGGLPVASKGERPAGVFDRRQRELLRRNNLYEPVRAVVRELFAEAGAPPDAGKKLPKVVIADVVTRPDTLRDALSDLWKIAYGPPRVVTVQRWSLLEPLMERIREAHEHGKWRFA